MSVLKNKNGHIKSGFKIVFLLLIKILLDIALSRVYVIVVKKIFNSNTILSNNETILMDVSTTVYSVILNGIMIVITLILWTIFEKKKICTLGLPSIKYHYRELIMGICIGIFAVSLIEGILILFNTVQVAEPSFKQNSLLLIGRGLIISVLIAGCSEVFYRGYIMSLLKNTNKYLIIGISVLAEVSPFLLMNKFNLLVFINYALLSLLLAYIFMKTKNIWMNIGFCCMWNYMQNYIYGFRNRWVDGSGIYQLQHIKNNLLNGGEFGPQGGIAVTLIICLVFLFVYFYYRDNDLNEFMVED